MADTRVIDLQNGVRVKIRKPSLAENRKGEWEYSRVFNTAITEGILPREALIEKVREIGRWTDIDDAKVESFKEQIAVLTTDLEAAAAAKDVENTERLRLELSKARTEYFMHIQKLNVYLANCAEEKANDARVMRLVFLCTTKEDGTPYWKTMKDLEEDTDIQSYSIILYNFTFLLNGVDENFLNNLPENSIKVETDA